MVNVIRDSLSGDGYGYGSGDGYGDGYGYGYGYGSGDGYGSGYGDGKHAAAYLAAIIEPHKLDRPHRVAFWRCNSDNTPANGGRGTVAKIGLIEEIEGPLKICTANALHATLQPENFKGSHWWIVALHGDIQQQEDKVGALKREFIAPLGKCPF